MEGVGSSAECRIRRAEWRPPEALRRRRLSREGPGLLASLALLAVFHEILLSFARKMVSGWLEILAVLIGGLGPRGGGCQEQPGKTMKKKCRRLGAFKRKSAEVVGAIRESASQRFGAFKEAFTEKLAPSRFWRLESLVSVMSVPAAGSGPGRGACPLFEEIWPPGAVLGQILREKRRNRGGQAGGQSGGQKCRLGPQ